jgi:hypothetical protein
MVYLPYLWKLPYSHDSDQNDIIKSGYTVFEDYFRLYYHDKPANLDYIETDILAYDGNDFPQWCADEEGTLFTIVFLQSGCEFYLQENFYPDSERNVQFKPIFPASILSWKATSMRTEMHTGE